jgi:hypothetical protein
MIAQMITTDLIAHRLDAERFDALQHRAISLLDISSTLHRSILQLL